MGMVTSPDTPEQQSGKFKLWKGDGENVVFCLFTQCPPWKPAPVIGKFLETTSTTDIHNKQNWHQKMVSTVLKMSLKDCIALYRTFRNVVNNCLFCIKMITS